MFVGRWDNVNIDGNESKDGICVRDRDGDGNDECCSNESVVSAVRVRLDELFVTRLLVGMCFRFKVGCTLGFRVELFVSICSLLSLRSGIRSTDSCNIKIMLIAESK